MKVRCQRRFREQNGKDVEWKCGIVGAQDLVFWIKLNRQNEVTWEVMKQFRAPAECFSREKCIVTTGDSGAKRYQYWSKNYSVCKLIHESLDTSADPDIDKLFTQKVLSWMKFNRNRWGNRGGEESEKRNLLRNWTKYRSEGQLWELYDNGGEKEIGASTEPVIVTPGRCRLSVWTLILVLKHLGSEHDLGPSSAEKVYPKEGAKMELSPQVQIINRKIKEEKRSCIFDPLLLKWSSSRLAWVRIALQAMWILLKKWAQVHPELIQSQRMLNDPVCFKVTVIPMLSNLLSVCILSGWMDSTTPCIISGSVGDVWCTACGWCWR